MKPIIGVDFYVAARTRQDKQAGVDSRRTRLVLLAKDLTGYKNLIQLVTTSNLDGFYYKPRIDRELIEKYHEGLICISPSISSEIIQALKMSDKEKAKALIDYFKKIYGADNFYLELTHHPALEGHEKTMQTLIDIARETATPLVSAHDSYYLSPEDKAARKTLMLVNTNDSAERMSRDDDEEDFSFISPEKASELFRDTPEALENTLKIAEKCNLELPLGKWVFPKLHRQSGKSYDGNYEHWFLTASKKYRNDSGSRARIEYELKVIKDKRLFTILW